MTGSEPLPAPDATCDGGDLDCGSGLLLIIREAMAPLADGGVLEVRSRESSVREDLPAWCRLVGHGLLAAQPASGGYTHYLVRKKHKDQEFARDLEQARRHVWQVRVRWQEGMQAKVAVRNHSFLVGQPASFDTEDKAPSALEYLLAAAGAAVATGLQWRLSRQGIAVRQLEVVVKARCTDILVFLGMAEPGDPGLAATELTVYLDADADDEVVEATLADTLRRCPVIQSLQRSVPVQARWRGVS